MINHFRTLLLNLSNIGVATDYIPTEFTAQVLSGRFLSIYQILFPPGSSRQRVMELGQAYLELLRAANIEEVVTAQDTRITYELDSFKNFTTPSIDLDALFRKFNTGNVEAILSQKKKLNTDKYDNLWLYHPNKLYKLAGLIAAYVIRL